MSVDLDLSSSVSQFSVKVNVNYLKINYFSDTCSFSSLVLASLRAFLQKSFVRKTASVTICKYRTLNDPETNTCRDPECPTDSIGTYPNCKCVEKNFDYGKEVNKCFQVCPDDSTGYWPDCKCDVDGYGFYKSFFRCVACPIDSTGTFPDCKCTNENATYNNFNNKCRKCEDGSTGIYPDCICPDVNEVSFGGRCHKKLCPFTVGGGGEYPNCMCKHPAV